MIGKLQSECGLAFIHGPKQIKVFDYRFLATVLYGILDLNDGI